ncbi:MAG: protein translocase subunit SecD, partial [Acidimicrobiales bacterium]
LSASMRKKRGFTSLIVISVLAVGWLAYTLTLGGRSPQLGLDLQGGTSVVLAPKKVQGQPDPSTDALDQTIKVIRQRVDGLGVAEPEITRQGNFIVVALPGVKEQDQALRTVGRTARLTFRPACVVQIGGQSLPELPTGQPDELYQQALTAAVAGPCVSPSGATTPSTVVTAPPDTSVATTIPPVSIPPVSAPDTTPNAAPGSSSQSLGLTPQGHLGVGQTDPTSSVPAPTDPPAADPATTDPATTAPTTTGSTATTEATTTTTTTGDPRKPCGETGYAAADAPDESPIIAEQDADHDGKVEGCAVLGPAAFDGTFVASAQAAIPNGVWVVDMTFSDAGLTKFNELVGHCFNKDQGCTGGTTAIVLDGRVQSNPRPQTATFAQNQIQISGPTSKPLTQSEAADLALVLNYGSLPVQLEQQRVESVSATLGRDSLHAGLIAGGIGLLAVCLYMILYYRSLGVVVVLGLTVWSALNFSIITFLSGNAGLALSLSGVTGIVVSVGVTTDSYIVYFERMKDEVKTGRTVRSAVDHAFARAWHTIVAADLASLIGALLLYWLTVGQVRGFAFFLGLSTLLDLVTAYFFKRPMVALLAKSRFFTDARWFGMSDALGVERTPRIEPAPAGGGGG